MGLQSNFGSLLRRLEGCWDLPAHTEVDGRKLAVAERCRKIRAKLEACPPEAQAILFKAFGGTHGAVDHLAVMMLSEEVHALHAHSRTKRPLGEWLQRMRDSQDSYRRRVYGVLRHSAERAIDGACHWFEASEETTTSRV